MQSALSKILAVVLILISISKSHAQSRPLPAGTRENQKSRYEQCDQAIFTKVSTIPALKVSHEAYADSLKKFLTSRNQKATNGKVIFEFIVMKSGSIQQVQRISRYRDVVDNTISEAIISFEHLWQPALQNDHTVCAYVKLELNIDEEKTAVRIYQQ